MIQRAAFVLLLGISFTASSFGAFEIADTPEIDAAAGVQAMALLSGAVMLIRSRRKTQR